MSAGVVSGAVALLLETNPALTPNAIKAILQFTALPVMDDTGQPYDVLTQGVGALNVEGALRLATAVNPKAPVGTWWLTAGVTPSTTTDGETLGWSQLVIWGSDIASGDGIYYNREAWAHNIVWGGLRAHWAENLVHGSNIVWGGNLVKLRAARDLDLDGNNIVWGVRKR
jgi:hypothetical protein